MRKFTIYRLLLVASCMLAVLQGHAQADEARALINKARDCVNKKRADSAIIYADNAMPYAAAAKSDVLKAKAMTLKGKALFQKGNSKDAIDLYFKALRLCKSPTDDQQIAYIYGEIGYVYFNEGRPEQAKEYYEKEVAIRRVANGRDSIGNQLINLSVMYQQMNMLDSAGHKLNEIADILTRNNSKPLRGYYYLNKGALCQVTNKLDSSRHYYSLAYNVWSELKDQAQLFRITFNLGFLAYQVQDYRQAIRYYHMAEGPAATHGATRELGHLYGTMAESYAAISDYKNAYTYLHKYAELSDSINKQDFNDYATRLDKQFHAEKQRETIRDQQMKLQAASLQMQQHKSRNLLIILVLVALLFVAAIVATYLTFKGRVARKVEEAKNKFFDNVAHEIRTPLSMIQAPVKMLQTQVTDKEAREQLAIADRNITRLNDLINQMLDISKIDADKYKLSESAGSLASFFEDIARQYKLAASGKNISFVDDVSPLPGIALFDRDALEKVTGNLLGNAIKYTPAGGTIGLHIANVSGNLLIRVWDTGAGIPRDEQGKIFQRFYRRQEHEASGTKGIGIGLALTAELVQLMNGSIEVESEPGKGSVFTVTVPLKIAIETIAVAAPGTDAPVILLAEDDADILRFNKALLTKAGYEVITATDGNEASAALQQQLPDLIITDLMMPGKDGLALLREVRAEAATDHIPVIILSARSAPQAKLEGIKQGAQVFLSKPFLPDELLALVSNQLDVLQKSAERYRNKVSEPEQPFGERFAAADGFTQKCIAIINEHLDDVQLSVERLAELMNVNRSHFQRKIKTLTTYSPSELIRIIRLQKAQEMLRKKGGSIKEIAYSTGFTSQSYFSKCFTEHFGYPPSQEVAVVRETATN